MRARRTRGGKGKGCLPRALASSVLSLVLLSGCAPTTGGTSALVSSTTPKRVVMQIINNACGEETEDTESLTTGTVKGLTKVLNGFGIPYSQGTEEYSATPQPITDDSETANKNRGIGYCGSEAHYLSSMKDPSQHISEHEEAGYEDANGGSPFAGLLSPEEEEYAVTMRWEYTHIPGYKDFMTGNGTGQMQYVAIHCLQTDKWCIACPYDWGPRANPILGSATPGWGRIGGATPAVTEALGFYGQGDCPEVTKCEFWWVENSSQVQCGPVNDLSAFENASGVTGTDTETAATSGNASVGTAIVTAATGAVASAVASDAGTSSSSSFSVTPANPNAFVRWHGEVVHSYGELPADRVRYIVLHDTNVRTDGTSDTLETLESLGIDAVPHFVVDRDGVITQCVELSQIAHHAGVSEATDANAEFGLSQERDTSADVPGAHAMDAWSVGIALVHESDDGVYPQVQLNALDRLIAYIDQQIGHEAHIITEDNWRYGLGNKPARLDAEDEEEPNVWPLYAIDEDPTDDERRQSAMSGTSDLLPTAEYETTRNHGGTESEEKALAIREAGGCSDSEDPLQEDEDAGGMSIAKKAVELTDEQTDVPPVDAAITQSGADASFPAGAGISRQGEYFAQSAKWQQAGVIRVGDVPSQYCQPGDVLLAEDGSHAMIYVSSDAVQERFPSSDANMFDGGDGTNVGRLYTLDAIRGGGGYAVWRLSSADNGSTVSESARIAQRRIWSLESPTGWLTAVDYDRNAVHFFSGHAGAWKLERSDRCITGPYRYFGNEWGRTGRTSAIGLFSYPGRGCEANYLGNGAWSKAAYPRGFMGGGDVPCFHLYVSPPIKKGDDPYTYGTDVATQRLERGKNRASYGCFELPRDVGLWSWHTIPQAYTTCYVWTETPATEKDRFENETLKQIMVSKGYCDIGQLTESERSLVTLNTRFSEGERPRSLEAASLLPTWTWDDVVSAYRGEKVTGISASSSSSSSGSSYGVDVTRA